MAIKVAINGYGRIGRNILRAIVEQGLTDQFDVVAINDLGAPDVNAHLTKYDTTHGTFNADVSVDGQDLIVNGDRFKVFAERDPSKLPWKDLDVDVVLECTGHFRDREKAGMHLAAGAKKVIISAPAKGEVDATVVFGVNEGVLKSSDQIISNASCTTNCLAPMAKALNDAVGIESGLMTTVHAYTNGQVLADSYHSDLRRARSATMSMIPTTTGAAVAVGLVLPELVGKLDGFAMRVPTLNVSIVDLTFKAGRETSVDEINSIMKAAADGKVIGYSEAPLVSIDYNHTSTSSNFDANLTRLLDGNLVKVCSWYDNEWGFSCRMLDTAQALMKA
ncbi:MAG: type I glyceraldehyde-3-phosphate dehydrogenase [Gammaproteobacteria bacterium]|nr:type I glyceraldehyde-3-phosphate dehydrogenase [Gammaproteobacteria bacterium]